MRRDGDQIATNARVAIFCSDLSAPGGAERVVFEEADALRRLGRDVKIVTFAYAPEVTFSGRYESDVTLIESKWPNIGLRFPAAVISLSRFLMNWQPDLVVAMSAGDCARLFVPALLTRSRYITHINGTQFWFPPEEDMTKYSWRYRRTLRQILEVSPRHEEFVPRTAPRISPGQRIRLELTAALHRAAVRYSRERIAFSRRMAWEIELVYGKPGRSLKGAFPASLLEYVPRTDPVARYRVGDGPVILNINRLDPRKRVVLVIEAFERVLQDIPGAVLLIGGVGSSEYILRELVARKGLGDQVHFLGFVKETELWDWLACCDAFVHPNWAEFAIAPYEALAVGTNVVWSSEMEMDPVIEGLGHVFPADPEPGPMAEQIVRAINADPATPSARAALHIYTWEHYFAELNSIIDRELEISL